MDQQEPPGMRDMLASLVRAALADAVSAGDISLEVVPEVELERPRSSRRRLRA
jgi:hypothetical protein